MTFDEEVDIIMKVRRGDAGAFEELVREHQPRVYNHALRMTGDAEDASDLTQDVMLRAYKSLDQYRGESRFSVWLYRLTRNACIDLLRKKKPESSLTIESDDGSDIQLEIPDIRFSPETVMERRELINSVNRGLNELPPEHSEILIMREIVGLSYEEIGQLLEIPPGTVKSRLYRARSRLAEILLRSGSFGNFSSRNPSGGNFSSPESSKEKEREV